MLNLSFYVRVLWQTLSWIYSFQENLFRHFHSGEHTGFLENVKTTLIDKTDGQNPKEREDYWRRTLQTYALFGLNVEDSV